MISSDRNECRVRVVDSHTEGEPTRVVLEGGPDLGFGPLRDRLDRFRADHDAFRRAVVREPRGYEAVVGALLCEPHDPEAVAGVIFFDHAGFLGMCGHGMIGLITTLAWQGRIGVGTHGVETPVGTVTATLSADGRVAVRNVRSYRVAKGVPVSIPSEGTERAVVMHGDLAWGGNWFFLVSDHGVPVLEEHCTRLTEVALRVRTAAHAAGYPEVDHVELLGPPGSSENDGRSFVLCPSGTYDRSPCGTGTSAKLACLAADGALVPGAIWRQEGILGTVFEGCFEWATAGDPAQGIIPTIRARAWVTGAGELVFRSDDPLRNGRAG